MDIRVLEKNGKYKLVDLILAGYGDKLDRYKPEWEREQERIGRPSAVETSPPPDLELFKRLKSREKDKTNMLDIQLTDPSIPPAMMLSSLGFISPSGQCYQVKGWHDSWAKNQLRGYNIETGEEFPYKSRLQRQGWIAYRPSYFMTYTPGNSHADVRPEDLTTAQKDVIMEMYNMASNYQKDILIRSNPYLGDLFNGG